METSLGQYHSQGPVEIWKNIVPLAKGTKSAVQKADGHAIFELDFRNWSGPSGCKSSAFVVLW